MELLKKLIISHCRKDQRFRLEARSILAAVKNLTAIPTLTAWTMYIFL